MNSFYDAPRLPPVPVAFNRVTPVVPEVSMLLQNKQPNSYNNWRCPNPQFKPSAQFTANQGSILKKSVRFEGPQNIAPTGPILTEKPLNLQGKTFEEIYMANIPNRHLDLSILEPKVKEKENIKPSVESPKIKSPPQPPKTYKEFRQTKPEFITDIYNYRSPSRIKTTAPKLTPPPTNYTKIDSAPKKIDNVTQTTVHQNNDEPSLKDLFKIIQQQNDQIIQLQKQVLSLQGNRNAQIEDAPKPQSSPMGARKTFSIDLTSFEVSFRPQQNLFHRKKDFVINEPKIQEITEVDSVKNLKDLSLNMGESLHIREACPSPEPSIRINMDDYHSSDDDSSDDDAASEVGITFYNNLMEQVNNMLKNAEKQTNAEFRDNKKKKAVTQQTMEKVKEATLKHLKNMGVNLPIEKEIRAEPIQQRDFTKNDVNFEVKQLLMKYLPDEQLGKIAPQKHPESNDNLIPIRPEFSFATIQYMKKYNLLNDEKKRFADPKQQDFNLNNALDITKLKLQPKLL